ncbi:glycerate kinase [Pseudomonadota bacterium]
MSSDVRRDLLQIYQGALKAVDGHTCVRRALHGRCKVPTSLVAIGKAAQAMTLGAVDALGDGVVDGLVISKQGHLDRFSLEQAGLQGMEGGHPLPDENSLAAGQALLAFLKRQPKDVSLLFLISGGASSLVEVLRDDIGLEDLQDVNRWLLGSGLPIQQINLVRKALSVIKGGGLLTFLGQHRAEALLISDVEGDDPSVIGSGLLVSDPLLERKIAALSLPAWLTALTGRGCAPIEAGEDRVPLKVIANLEMACCAAERVAQQLGYPVVRHKMFLSGDAERRGHELGQVLLEEKPGVHIWGGETTVRLPDQPGRGGRNQHLALAAAMEIAGHKGVYLLAVGTDGTDGNTEDAGALVDGETLTRAANEGLDAGEYLCRADAGTLFSVTGDLINTGPTNTNVMDLVIGIKR